MRTLLFILFWLPASAQSITIAYLGDSHCNGGFGLGDSNWINRTNRFFFDQGFTVTSYKFCTGGETIRTNMPNWYPGHVSGKSIDDALAVNPDILFFLQSGNHTAFGIKQDTSKYCYNYIADTLRELGKRFMFSSIGPRQNTYSGGMNFASYNAQADSLNAWLYQQFPGQIFNIWDTLRDKATNKPYADLLRVDSLHYLAPGHRRMWQMTVHDSPAIDTITGLDKIHACNMVFTPEGIQFSSARIKYMQIFGSHDGISFTQVSYDELTDNLFFPITGYEWVKVIVSNYSRKITITKRFL